MSLPAVNWRYVGNQAFASATVAAVLDALFILGTAVVYADGSARVPGTGSAGTYSRFQNAGVTEAVYLTPAVTTALNQRIILAGYASAPTPLPTMASPDTAAANTLYVSVNKNSGAFNAWNAASPFTSGQFFGYWSLWPTSAGVGSVDLYESTESIWVVIRNSTGSATYHAQSGALLDPESVAALDAETDGRLYGVWTTGNGAASAGITFVRPPSNSDRVPLNHNAFNNANHAGIFTPGAGTLITAVINGLGALAPISTTSLRTRSGRYGRINSPVVYSTAAAPNDNVLGTWRGVSVFSNAILGQRQVDGPTIIGYLITAQSTATQPAYILLYA